MEAEVGQLETEFGSGLRPYNLGLQLSYFPTFLFVDCITSLSLINNDYVTSIFNNYEVQLNNL